MIGIYSVTHRVSGHRYIGKSIDIARRFSAHRSGMRSKIRPESLNRHLWAAAQEFGMDAFIFEVLELFEEVDDILIAMRELHWMGHFRSCERGFGYNLRADSRTRMLVHAETLALYSKRVGEKNPNFGKRWSDEQKLHMSNLKKQHAVTNPCSEVVRMKLSAASSARFAVMTPEQKSNFSKKVSESKRKYRFIQKYRNGLPVKIWESVAAIIEANPGWKWQNVYSVCDGYKKTYMGFGWEKVSP
jgi:group I intron endonuclease